MVPHHERQEPHDRAMAEKAYAVVSELDLKLGIEA